ncbi:MAG: hypothetical protein OEY13_17155, partial [Gammaproteobacteria bacterium]|nr:hypothetical protein [Gammaproteobacteria bacterium]
MLTIPLVAGEIDPGFPTQDVSAEKAEQLISWMAAGAGRAYRHFMGRRRAGARVTREEETVRRAVP